MCGICGIIDLKVQAPRETEIRSVMHTMKYRGPDDEGTFHEEGVHLGFVRLSIIDLTAAGHQPMLSRDNRHVLIFNGEIYNYLELRQELEVRGIVFRTRTDAEVLLTAYQEWGEDCLHRFNGMWAFAIYDRLEKKLFCSRDRYGVKPFYYLKTESAFAFASEIPPLLHLLDRKPVPDYQSIYDYLVFNRTDQGESTFFKGIKKLQHGCSLTVSLAESAHQRVKPKIGKWYDLQSNLKDPFKDAEEFRETFRSAVGLRLRSDVPLGVCLSGGLDSSSIVSVMLKDLARKDINTFSAVYGRGRTGDESEFIDLFMNEPLRMHFVTPTAESLRKDLGRFVRAMGEPVPTTSPYAQFKVMELAKNQVVVTLDGQGADEQLAGYHYFYGFFFKELLLGGHWLRLGSEALHYLNLHRSLFGLASLAYFMLPRRWRGKVKEQGNPYIQRDFVEGQRDFSTFASDLYGSRDLRESLLNHFEYKLEHLLKWEDRNSMAFSLEARAPFLDYRLVERTLSLSSERIISKGFNKSILREAMKGILPDAIRSRRDKVGFDTPMDEWFWDGPTKDFILQELQSSSFLRDIFNLKKAIKEFARPGKNRQSLSREIWKMLNLKLWHEQFILGKSFAK